jgi:hypothetical protein
MRITIFGSDAIQRDRRAEPEPAAVAAGKHLSMLFERWIVATPDRRPFALRITSYQELEMSFRSFGTQAEVTGRVRVAIDD